MPSSELTRVTVHYVPQEDRMRLSARTADQRVVALWLTQRLLSRLLVRLFPLLLPPPGPGEVGAARAACATCVTRAASVQSQLQAMAQDAAQLEHQPVAPVAPPETGWLVEQVTLGVELRRVRLGWCAARGEVAWMSLTPEALRQWLNILCATWQEASWPLALWPTWMLQDRASAPGPQGRPVMH